MGFSRMRITGAGALGAALLLGGCSTDDSSADWGSAAESFFEDWGVAWSSADPYDIVRFYDIDVAVGQAQDYRSLSLSAGYQATAVAGNGRAWLASWIDKQYEARTRSLDGLYLGRSEAVAMVTIDEVNTAVAIAMDMNEDAIRSYTDLRWRDAHLPGGAPDEQLAWLDDLVATYVAGWTDGDSDMEALYDTKATIEAFPAKPVGLETALSAAEFDYRDASIATAVTGDRVGPALFVGPDTAAIGLEATLQDGCSVKLMVLLSFTDQIIIDEKRLVAVDSIRRCYADEAPDQGWWNTLVSPLPVDEQITGSITGSDGVEITIVNGTPELERLLEWGLGRFTPLGLKTPRLASVTFGPVPACATAPGRVTETAHDDSDLILCTDSYAACLPDRATCVEFRSTDRLGLLHELGHAWLVDNATEETRNAYLALNDLASWRDGSIPWHQRGAEQAAETVAWGLMEEPMRLIRIGDPPCADIAASYQLLTGTVPRHNCDR